MKRTISVEEKPVFVYYPYPKIIFPRLASKVRIEFYETKLRYLVNGPVNKTEDILRYQTVNEISYSEITRFQKANHLRITTLFHFYDKEKKLVLTIPNTGKKKQLGNLSLADWIKSKASLQ